MRAGRLVSRAAPPATRERDPVAPHQPGSAPASDEVAPRAPRRARLVCWPSVSATARAARVFWSDLTPRASSRSCAAMLALQAHLISGIGACGNLSRDKMSHSHSLFVALCYLSLGVSSRRMRRIDDEQALGSLRYGGSRGEASPDIDAAGHRPLSRGRPTRGKRGMGRCRERPGVRGAIGITESNWRAGSVQDREFWMSARAPIGRPCA